jgi:ferredoxin
MRIRLDKASCAGHGLCNSIDSELFPLDENGYSMVEPHDVRPADEQRTREGVAVCPEQALIFDDVN